VVRGYLVTLTRIVLERFTAFERLDVDLSPGVNVFIGDNGTGKTHLLKIAYSACDITKTKGSLADKLIRCFLPFERRVGRLVYRTGKSSRAVAEVYRGQIKIRSSFSNHSKEPKSATITGKGPWVATEIESAYIPVKEVLANAPGFRSLYASREIAFEEIYADIIDRAFLPVPRGPQDARRSKLLSIIQKLLAGKVIHKDEHFFLRNKQGELEFTLLAEGMRKLALLWLLIQNGTLLSGSVLFWDEPESNLNPAKFGSLVEILLELRRMGVQVFLATHDYALLKEFDLRAQDTDSVCYHALYRDSSGTIRHNSADRLSEAHPNAIEDVFGDLYNRQVRRSLRID
jgi:ABC-type hemin transport system ATPase subunit